MMNEGDSIRVVVVSLALLLRLAELAWARHLQARGRRGGAVILPEAVFVWMVLLHAGWLGGALAEPLWLGRPLMAAVFWPMLGLWGVALALKAWTLRTMGGRWSVRLVHRRHSADEGIVTGGPFRFIRHPNYLAVILEMAALPLLTGAWITALAGSLANGLVLFFRIRGEEAHLFTIPAYRQAFAGKKRLVPGVF